MYKLLIILILIVPNLSMFAEEINISDLLNGYEEQYSKSISYNSNASELLKLRSQLIDLRVERDILEEENRYLKSELRTISSSARYSECTASDCIKSVDIIEKEEKVLSYLVYSLSLYRMAEIALAEIPESNIEAYNRTQNIMTSVLSDLDVLGFDTTKMEQYPSLEDLLEQYSTIQGSRLTK